MENACMFWCLVKYVVVWWRMVCSGCPEVRWPQRKKTTTQGSVNARAFIKTVIPTFTLMHTHTSPFFFSGPGQGAPSQYSQYQQGQSQQYSSYRSTQSTPGSQTQRSYTYEQVEHAHSTYSHTNRVCNTWESDYLQLLRPKIFENPYVGSEYLQTGLM